MSINLPESIIKELKNRNTSFNKSIAIDYEMFLRIKGIDNEMALVRARRIIEKITVKLHNDHISPSGKRNLHELIENLKRNNIINAIIYAQLLLVKEMGNYGAHSSEVSLEDEFEISDSEIRLCDQAVYLITKYYVDNFRAPDL